MVPSRVRLHPPPTPSKIVLSPYDFLPSWCHSKCIPISLKVSSLPPFPPTSIMQVSSSRICCHSLSLVLELSFQSSTYNKNLLFNYFAVKVSQSNQHMDCYFLSSIAPKWSGIIWITYNSHGYHPQLVLEN